jgi:ribosomal protein S18 acetylase RimI-like enzyme
MTKIRQYKKGDEEEIIKLTCKVLFEIFHAKARNISDLSNIKSEYFGKQEIFYVAQDKGKIVGTIAIKKEKDKTARLKRMFVDKNYRKQKIGQKLLNKTIEFCKNKRYKKIILSTYPQMKAAIKFYKKNGFKQYKQNEKIFFEKTL